MNDPMSRKLFQDRNAREKLRGMGGIMASSPELAQTVAKFQVGGPVEGPNTARLRQIREISRTLSEMQARTDIMREQERRRAAEAAARFNFLNAELPLVDEFSGLPSEMLEPSVTVPVVPAVSEAVSVGDFEFGGLPPEMTQPDEVVVEEPATREAAAAREALAEREALAAEEAAAARNEAEAVAANQETQAVDQAQEVARRAEEALTLNPEGGETGGFNFETTYEQMLARVGRVMGEGTDKSDREKAMANLAMIGLAIAAGQSPDALTNIAQGALTGMQAIRAQEAREEDLARESRLTALEMAEKEADRASRERIAGMRVGLTGEDPRQEYLYNATFSTTYQALVTDQGMDPAEAVVIARQRATEAAPNAPSARAAGAGGATIPSVTSPSTTELTDIERELLGL